MMKRLLLVLALTLPCLSFAADVKEPNLDGEINLPNYPAKGKAYAPRPVEDSGSPAPTGRAGKSHKVSRGQAERDDHNKQAKNHGRDLRPCLRHGKNKEVANCARFPNGQKELNREPVAKHEKHKGNDKVKTEKATKAVSAKAGVRTGNKRKHK